MIPETLINKNSLESALPAAPPPRLSIENVTKFFTGAAGRVQALDNVRFDVAAGEFVSIVGPSGCGKSTLLNMIAGLEFPDEGNVICNGARVTRPGSDRMVMFQESALFPWLDVLGNIMFGLNLKKNLSQAERRDRAGECLQLVGLTRFRRANIHELSGGMKQRIALARALAPDPSILLMDEPFAALDALTREQLYQDLQRIVQETRKTVLLVTHNVREAVCLGDRVLLFSPHPGRLREQYSIQLDRPRDINSVSLARYATDIMQSLRAHMEAEEGR